MQRQTRWLCMSQRTRSCAGDAACPNTWKGMQAFSQLQHREAVRGYVELDRQPTLFLDVPPAWALTSSFRLGILL